MALKGIFRQALDRYFGVCFIGKELPYWLGLRGVCGCVRLISPGYVDIA